MWLNAHSSVVTSWCDVAWRSAVTTLASDSAKVIGQFQGEVKSDKVVGAKWRRRKNSRKAFGHRQRHLQVTISEIVA